MAHELSFVEYKRPLEERELLNLAARLAEQMADLHEQQAGGARILLDPARIVVDARGRVLDASLDADPHRPLVPHYCSPEQAEGQRALPFASWAYSLGAFLHHLATGIKPLGEYPDEEVLSKVRTAVLPEANQLNPDLSPYFTVLLAKLLSRDSAGRPASLDELRRDLDRVRRGDWPTRAPSLSSNGNGFNAARYPDAYGAGAPPPQAAANGAPPRRVAVSRDQLSRVRKQQRHKRRRFTVSSFFYILVIVGACYAGWHYYLRDFVESRLAGPPPQGEGPLRDDEAPGLVASDRPETAPHPPRPPRREPLTRPAPGGEEQPIPGGETPVARDEGPRDEPGVWNDAEFQRGASLFNEALNLYQQEAEARRQGERPNQQSLITIEEKAREAARIFESVQPRAPDHIPIQDYIRHASQMVADARQSRVLLPPGQDQRPQPPVPSVPRPPQSVLVNGMVMAMNWNIPQPGSRFVTEELTKVLSPVAQARTDAVIRQQTVLWDDIRLLEPLSAVRTRRGLDPATRRTVSAPGWPYASVGVQTFSGSFEDGRYDTLTLITDLVDQVIGVQLSSGQPEQLQLPAAAYEIPWRVYDLLSGRLHTDHALRIARRVRAVDGIVRVETEVAEERVQGQLTPREYSVLILSQPLADLLLHRAGASR